jgi:hypothetical protein
MVRLLRQAAVAVAQAVQMVLVQRGRARPVVLLTVARSLVARRVTPVPNSLALSLRIVLRLRGAVLVVAVPTHREALVVMVVCTVVVLVAVHALTALAVTVRKVSLF